MALSLHTLKRGVSKAPPRILIYGSEKVGKALRNDMPVLMADGTWKEIGGMKVGDMVAVPDGGAAPVLGVFPQGVRDTYDLTTTDGTVVSCDLEHIWLTENKTEHANQINRVTNSVHDGWHLRTTRQIMEAMYSESKKGSFTAYIPCCSVDFGNTDDLPLDPYILGALLGDGGLTQSTPILTNIDEDVLDRFTQVGLQLNQTEENGISYRIPNISSTIRCLGLSGVGSSDKFIPEQYLKSSIENRIDLLRGLCDTDGSVAKDGIIEYTTVSEKLCSGVKSLVLSLGGNVSISSRFPKFTYKGERKTGKLSYRMILKFPQDITPVYCSRKAMKWKPRINDNVRRQVASIVKNGSAECTCIYIGHPKHLFITKDYLVTHNTTWAASAPSPIFLRTEDGEGKIDMASWDLKSFDDFVEAVTVLSTQEHDFQTVVIDTIDWFEPMIFAKVIQDRPQSEKGKAVTNIDDYGYGKGYLYAMDYWNQVIDALNYLRTTKDMMVILLAHTHIKPYSPPDSEAYDRFTLKMNEKASEKLMEFVDCIFFARKKVFVREDSSGKNKAVGTTEGREIMTESLPSFRAGNRYDLPASIPLDANTWSVIASAIPYFEKFK